MLPPEYGGRSTVSKYGESGVSSHTPSTPTQDQIWPLARLIGGRARVRFAHWDGRKKKWGYSSTNEQNLTDEVPKRAAAVMLYNSQGRCQTLVVDVDVAGAEGTAMTHQIVALFERCGGRTVVDRSPVGKYHVYLPLRDGLSVEDATRLVKALARRFPGVDPLPHSGAISGCIRTPGSPHKTGTGYQELITPLDTARRTLLTRNGTDVIRALEHELTNELAEVRREALVLATPIDELERENPIEDAPLDGPILSARMLQIAREGLYEAAGYADRSTARQAVLTAARRAGLTHSDVAARIEDGRWPGLHAMYANATTSWRKLLTRTEWPKAVALVAATPRTQNPVRNCNTSEVNQVTRGAPTPTTSNKFDEHRHIRRFRAVLHRTKHTEFPGRRGRLHRMVLEVLAAAAHKTGSRYVEFGVRNHSLSLPKDPSQVARALVELRNEEDPWIVLEQEGRGTRGDLYSLRIPDQHDALAKTLSLEAGKAHGLRPAFRVLGLEAAEIFAAIERGANSLPQIINDSGVGKTAVREHLGILQAWNLISISTNGNYLAHPENLDRTAELLGADIIVATLQARIRQQRAIWHSVLASRSTPSSDWWDAITRAGPPSLVA